MSQLYPLWVDNLNKYKKIMDNVKIFNNLLELKPEDQLHKHFNFDVVNGGKWETVKGIPRCGTFGCLAGELPQFSKEWAFDKGNLRWRNINTSMGHALSEFFNLPLNCIDAIFYPNSQEELGLVDVGEEATLKEVQHNARLVLDVIKKNGLY